MKRSVSLQGNNYSISPNFRVSNWHHAFDSRDWVLKISIFEDRLKGRYLKPIELIESDDKIGPFAGFSIMALACLLVETLNQFYQGLDETPKKHEEQFWKFFRESENFQPHFTRRTSKIFYSHVRCGLLHQAQTKGVSIIRADQEKMIQLIHRGENEGLIVDRVHFLAALRKEVSNYTRKLRSDDIQNAKLRENFIKKMQYICGDG